MERGELCSDGGLKRTKDEPGSCREGRIRVVLLSIPSLHQLKLTIPWKLLKSSSKDARLTRSRDRVMMSGRRVNKSHRAACTKLLREHHERHLIGQFR